MSEQATEDVFRRFNVAFFERDWETLERLCADPMVVGGTEIPRATAFERMRETLGNFADIDYDIEYVLADGDRVATSVEMTVRLVEQWEDLPPTGQSSTVGMFGHGRIEDGQVVAISVRFDRRQLVPDVARYGRRRLVDTMDAGVIIVDRDGIVVDANQRALDTVAADREAVLGEPAAGLYGGPRELPDPGETVELTDTPDGRSYELSASWVTDAGDERIGQRLVFRDITDRRRRIQRLEVLNRVLRHNLRNEITAILGNVDRVREHAPELPAAASAGLDSIADASDRLDRLGRKARTVETALSEPRAGLVEHDVGAVARRLVARARETYPDVRIAYEGPESATVTAPDSLPDALWELVENACEHSDADEPRVTVAVSAGDDGVELQVRDDGPGIPDYEWTTIERGEETPLQHGSGLGLWLAYWVVQAAGGSMQYEPNDPRGSVVRVTLQSERPHR